MQEDEKRNIAISCLTHAIEDVQNTIRAYDIKAEILAVLLTIVIGLASHKLFEVDAFCSALALAPLFTGLISIFLLGLVLYPKKNFINDIQLGIYKPRGTYYLHNISSSSKNLNELATESIDTDWVIELTYENMKLSAIRDRKHRWFIWALRVSGATFILFFISLLMCG